MLKTTLVDSDTGKTLENRLCFSGHQTLLTETSIKLNARWLTKTNTAIETLNAVTPLPGRSIFVTDLIVTSSKKVALSTIKVQFSDGINTVPVIELEAASEPVAFSHTFAGGLIGWKDAILQVTTNQPAMSVTTLIGYIHIVEAFTKPYNIWLAER